MEHSESPEPLAIVHRGGQDRECSYKDLVSRTEPQDPAPHSLHVTSQNSSFHLCRGALSLIVTTYQVVVLSSFI